MFRFLFLIIVGLILRKSAFAQTQKEIDSIKAQIQRLMKNAPRPTDSEIRAHRPPPPPTTPDTAHIAWVRAYKPQAEPALFETAFFNLSSYKQDTFTIYFAAVDIGEINSETGRLIVCDPIVMRDIKPFVQQFPIGRFRVQLSIANYKGKETVAFSRIYFSDQPVVKWEFALHSGQRQASIFGDTLYAYSVDGAAAIFIDERANQAFAALERTDDVLFERATRDEMNKHDHGSWQYGTYSFEGHNLVSFTTGVGDGRYGAYVGYDKDGKICRLLTDFGLFEWWKG